LPATVALHDTVDVPDPVRVFGIIGLHVRPDGTRSVRVTTTLNPFIDVIVMVEDAEEPAFTGAGELAAMPKSHATYVLAGDE
jgi:hypothetical protein